MFFSSIVNEANVVSLRDIELKIFFAFSIVKSYFVKIASNKASDSSFSSKNKASSTLIEEPILYLFKIASLFVMVIFVSSEILLFFKSSVSKNRARWFGKLLTDTCLFSPRLEIIFPVLNSETTRFVLTSLKLEIALLSKNSVSAFARFGNKKTRRIAKILIFLSLIIKKSF